MMGRRGFRWRRFLLSVVLLTATAACGFRPLYEPSADGASERLAAIEVTVIPDRPGQQLRNELIDLLNPDRAVVPGRYRLDVRLQEELDDRALERSGFATRANLTMEADFALFELAHDEPLMRASSRAVSSYNLVDSKFTTLTSGHAARTRALSNIAHDIRRRLAVYFARDPDTAAAPGR
jgi:LPS-assembly lipoprotein